MKNYFDWESVPVVMDIPKVAIILGMTPDKIRMMCRKKEIPCFKVGKEWRTSKDSLINYINTMQQN